MNKFSCCAVRAVYFATLIFILPFIFLLLCSCHYTDFQKVNNFTLDCGNTPVPVASNLHKVQILQNVIEITNCDSGFKFSADAIVSGRLGGCAELKWHESVKISIISSDYCFIYISNQIFTIEEFNYIDIEFKFDNGNYYVLINNHKISTDTVKIDSFGYTTITTERKREEFYTEHGNAIDANGYTCLLNNDDNILIFDGKRIIPKYDGDIRAYMLNDFGIITEILIHNARYVTYDYMIESLNFAIDFSFDDYEVKNGDAHVKINENSITFPNNGYYTIEFKRGRYTTVINFTVDAIINDDNGNNGNEPNPDENVTPPPYNGSNPPPNNDSPNGGNDDSPNGGADKNDNNSENNNPNGDGGNNEDNTDGDKNSDNDEEDKNDKNEDYNFEITRRLDYAKIIIVATAAATLIFGLIILVIFLRKKRHKN